MAQYTIIISLENAAFKDSRAEGLEVGRILRSLANHCKDKSAAQNCALIDSNGNAVGTATRTG